MLRCLVSLFFFFIVEKRKRELLKASFLKGRRKRVSKLMSRADKRREQSRAEEGDILPLLLLLLLPRLRKIHFRIIYLICFFYEGPTTDWVPDPFRRSLEMDCAETFPPIIFIQGWLGAGDVMETGCRVGVRFGRVGYRW